MKNKETLEEVAERLFGKHFNGMHYDDISDKHIIKYGLALAKWQQERMYSEEEVLKLLLDSEEYTSRFNGRTNLRSWFEQFKKK
jgi:hypothetical protein